MYCEKLRYNGSVINIFLVFDYITSWITTVMGKLMIHCSSDEVALGSTKVGVGNEL